MLFAFMARSWTACENRGIAGLGLIMQYVGLTTLGVQLFLLFDTTDEAKLAAAATLAAVFRSCAHVFAGYCLASNKPIMRRSVAICVYVLAAAFETFLAWKTQQQTLEDVGLTYAPPYVVADTVGSVLWPLILGLFTLRLGANKLDNLPDARDANLTSVGALMAILGTLTGITLLFVVASALVGTGGHPPLVILIAGVLLLVREGVQIFLGIRVWATPALSLRRIQLFNSVATSLGLITLVLAMIVLNQESEEKSTTLFVGLLVAVYLFGWPLILHRFVSERQNHPTPHFDRRANFDVFAWVLIAVGVHVVTVSLQTWADMIEFGAGGSIQQTALYSGCGFVAIGSGVLILSGRQAYRYALFALFMLVSALVLREANLLTSPNLHSFSPLQTLLLLVVVGIISIVVAMRNPSRHFDTLPTALLTNRNHDSVET